MINELLIPTLFFSFCALLYMAGLRQKDGFKFSEIIMILGVRCLLGFLYGYIFAKYFNGDDTWYFHQGSIEEHAKLVSNPYQFFTDINPIPNFRRYATFGEGWYYYLSDLEFWLMSKPMAFFNFITRGNYYANIVCFNFLVCRGSIWLYRFFKKVIPNQQKLLFFCVFIMPVPLFWMSGIRAEGWLLFFIAGGLISFQRLLNKVSLGYLAWFLLSLMGILILRSMLLFLLIPVLSAWFLQLKRNWQPVKSLALVFGIGLLLFFGSVLLDAKSNLPNIVVKRQEAFFSLHGQTRIPLDSLSGNPVSFIRVFPQAVGNSFVRPFLWEAKGWLQVVAALSTIFLLGLTVLYIWRPLEPISNWYRKPAVLYPAIFAILLYLFIGYTIPFPGAIIRYKSIGEWFLLVPLILSIKWPYLNK